MNSHLKSNDSILIDSLTYYLEAGTNYTYGISSAKAEFEKIPGRAVRYLPAPPQSRTSGFPASGSSS